MSDRINRLGATMSLRDRARLMGGTKRATTWAFLLGAALVITATMLIPTRDTFFGEWLATISETQPALYALVSILSIVVTVLVIASLIRRYKRYAPLAFLAYVVIGLSAYCTSRLSADLGAFLSTVLYIATMVGGVIVFTWWFDVKAPVETNKDTGGKTL